LSKGCQTKNIWFLKGCETKTFNKSQKGCQTSNYWGWECVWVWNLCLRIQRGVKLRTSMILKGVSNYELQWFSKGAKLKRTLSYDIYKFSKGCQTKNFWNSQRGVKLRYWLFEKGRQTTNFCSSTRTWILQIMHDWG
jgi:hypothetical protein